MNNLKQQRSLVMFEPWQGIEISEENKLLWGYGLLFRVQRTWAQHHVCIGTSAVISNIHYFYNNFFLVGLALYVSFAWPLCWWQLHGHICYFSNRKLTISNLELGLFLIWILTNENLPYLFLNTFASLCEGVLLQKSDLSFHFLLLLFLIDMSQIKTDLHLCVGDILFNKLSILFL